MPIGHGAGSSTDPTGTPPKMTSSDGGEGERIIDVRGLGKTYRTKTGQVAALEDIDLEVRQGEFLSIVGPSGCGKSTLVKIIAGLNHATSGSVTVLGNTVTAPYPDYGIVFQHPTLLWWRTIVENVMLQVEVRGLDRDFYLAKAQEILSFVGLGDFGGRYPDELSGGMQQRASICRALVHDPAILFMDEPFGALDALTRETMGQEIQRIWLTRRKTVLFITHSIPEAVLLSDRVVVMTPRPGRIQEIHKIDLKRPRDLEMTASPEFGSYVSTIRRCVRAQSDLD